MVKESEKNKLKMCLEATSKTVMTRTEDQWTGLMRPLKLRDLRNKGQRNERIRDNPFVGHKIQTFRLHERVNNKRRFYISYKIVKHTLNKI